MRPNRSHSLTLIALSAALLFCVLVLAQSADPPLQGKATLVYIGSKAGKGIHLFRLQPTGTEVSQNVTLVPLGLAAETPHAMYFELDLKRRLLFAVNEIEQFESKPTGAVSAFSIQPNGKLTLLTQRSSLGTNPSHLALDSEAHNPLVTNCGDGSVAMLPIAADSKLGEAAAVIKSTRAASATFDRAGKFAFVCDPAADNVLRFSFDAQTGKLRPATPVPMKEGAGPRQLLFRWTESLPMC